MSEDAYLEREVAPVAEFHKAKHLTPHTVLAAHVRALGGLPVGTTWHAARDAYEDGNSFEAAARIALGLSPDDGDQPQKQVGVSEDDVPHGRSGTSRDQVGRTAPAMPPAEPSTTPEQSVDGSTWPRPAPGETVVHFPAAVTKAAAPVDVDRHLVPRRANRPAPLQGDGSMAWFPKPFGPGDIHGTGAVKLLGTPNVPLSTVLVRETAQNSWDARVGGQAVSFSIHLRTLTGPELDTLRDRILTGEGSGLKLRNVLAAESVRVLEVSDRGTKGLGGPIRNDLAPPLHSPTNFIDLIFNIGAPRDVHLGAGTYGFGKTIAYRVSGAGTVLFWSRSVEEHGVEDRLIGSAFGRAFDSDGKAYTGRHWWGGLRDSGTRVEPWTGDDARLMAQSVFDAKFESEQTGTSLMIIDPQLGGGSPDEDVQRLADGILWNLWPKLLPTATGTLPMSIQLLHEGREVPLPRLDEHPVLSGFAEALRGVRAVQEGMAFSPVNDTVVHEVRLERPAMLLGHLALTKFLRPVGGHDESDRDTVSVHDPSHHIALMRHDAELVVKYMDLASLENEVGQWAGVFKPLAELDDAFAQAEPPAHDDWMPQSVEDKRTRRQVNVALRRLRELTTLHLNPRPAVEGKVDDNRSVAALADSLAKLVVSAQGNAPRRSQRPSSKQRAPRAARKAQVKLLARQGGQLQDGYRTLFLKFQVTGAAEPAVLQADVGAATEGGRLRDEDLVRALGWTEDLLHPLSFDEPVLNDGDTRWLAIRMAESVALDMDVKVKE